MNPNNPDSFTTHCRPSNPSQQISHQDIQREQQSKGPDIPKEQQNKEHDEREEQDGQIEKLFRYIRQTI